MSYHDEIRDLLDEIGEAYEGNSQVVQLRAHAERLLALPEASIEALAQAAQFGVAAVEAALAINQFGPSPLGGETENFSAKA